MNPKIKFGTDGWRGLIARDFTFETVSLAARGVAETMKKEAAGKKAIIVGYDRRFLSRAFAETVAIVYADEGYEVLIPEIHIPTPALSFAAKFEPNVVGATIITASHNPPAWNGFKFKETFGGSARPTLTEKFERKISELAANHSAPDPALFSQYVKKGKIRSFDPMPKYVKALLGQVDLETIRNAKLQIGLDVMYGAAGGHFPKILKDLGVSVDTLHNDENPGFNGTPPEPIGKNLVELCKRVHEKRYACGLATDGDADRLGAVDEEGNAFTTQQILSTVYWHMIRGRKKYWSIARSVSTTRMVDLIAKRAGRNAYETPVGFKFIAEKMVAGEAQIGGEESGGIGIIDHIPERDGLLTGLLLLEMIGRYGKGLKAIYDDLCNEERPYYFTRLDLHLTSEQMNSSLKRLKENPPKDWNGRALETLLTIDGYKFYLNDGSWILIRPSGTEPIFRLYAEAESVSASEKLVATAREFVEQG